jgi:putative colanic acid biosynthesis glycosyltransferase
MRIVQVNSVCGVGSTGRIATDIHHELINDGHTSMIAFGRNEPKNCDAVYRIGSSANIYCDVFMTRIFDLHGSAGKRATRAFCAMIEEFRPDVVHLHNIHGYYLNIEILMAYLKKSNIPLVWTLHDCWSFTGHCAYFDFPKCDKWKSGCGRCPRKNDYPASWLFDNSSNNLQNKKRRFSGFTHLTFVTPSTWLKELVAQSYLKQYPVEVIPNGINLAIFKPTASDLRSKYSLVGKKVLLSVAMVWERRKGLHDLLELAARFDDDERLILIGLDEKQIQALPGNVLGIKRTSNAEELAAFYTMADLTLLPSYEDNFPTVVLESLACHTPVLAYRTGGIPEMGKPPYLNLVEKGDLEGMRKFVVEYKKCEAWEMDDQWMDKKGASERVVSLYRAMGKATSGT